MLYYVYFDAYGHVRRVVNERALAEEFGGDPDRLLRAMCRTSGDAEKGRAAGHVGTLAFNSDEELNDYLRSLGDEIEGFFGCEADSRPYNF
jgi:hypothetical protein